MYRSMMLGIIAVVMMIVAFPNAERSIAQDGDIEWRYAYNASQVAAYTLDGEVNVLLDDMAIRPARHIMFSEYNAIVELEMGETRTYYHLTPQSAEPLALDPTFNWVPVVLTDRYVVLHGDVLPFRRVPNILYDVQTRQVHELQGVSAGECCGFSADGQTLRYVAYPPEIGDPWSIIERTLETGEERVLFSPDVDFERDPYGSSVFLDTHGELWYWRFYDVEMEQHSVNLVLPNGTNEVIETYRESEGAESIYFSKEGLIPLSLLRTVFDKIRSHRVNW